MRMRTVAGVLLLFALALRPGFALVGVVDDKEDSFRQIQNDFFKALSAAFEKDGQVDEDLALECINRCFVLADLLEEDEGIVEALSFVSQITGYSTSEATIAAWHEATERLIAEYVDQPAMVQVVFSLNSPPDRQLQEDADAYLVEIRQDSTCHDVHGAFAFLKADEMMEKQAMGTALLPAQRNELVALLKQIQAEYADVQDPYGRGSFGEIAGNMLFDLEHLSIGKVAPEIEGADLDGTSFKLSDYRGKVVLLDFWGHW